jgi:uncharacterized coiled-coil protein SlyX
MKNTICIPRMLLIVTLLFVAGCGESGQVSMKQMAAEPPAAPAPMEIAFAPDQRERNPYLAYQHTVYIEVEADRLEASFQNTLQKCLNDAANGCEVHLSNLFNNDYAASAEIQVRIRKQGVAPLIQTASEHNKITQQIVSAEDLAAPILDSEKRIKLLQSYQQRLVELESRSAKDIESLIKVSSEIAKTQSELEAARGENAHLLKRIDMDIVSIHFQTDYEDSIIRPISEATGSFGHNLAQAIAALINFIAFSLPWVALGIGLFLVWRWRRKRAQKN